MVNEKRFQYLGLFFMEEIPAITLDGISTPSNGTAAGFSFNGSYAVADIASGSESLEARINRASSLMLRFFDEFISSSEAGFPEEWDRHSLIVRAGNRSFVIGEVWYIAILLVFSMLILLFPLFSRLRFLRYARILGQQIWSIPVLTG